MLKLAIVKGVKNENGVFVAPTEIKPEDVLFKGEGEVNITGLESGDVVADGEYFVGKFSDEANKFTSPLAAVPGWTVEGEASVGTVKVQATDDGASITTDKE
ncbi:hypothetical protein MOO46_07555 (plasmid) [Apilactobacillus apisilvae]|uniref:Uncharacterized protein n=1 Tax=Apilactobacillus apisilvae TaxID=2923364 RepID=A0ABY4PJF3_9LACO|nr:hypothetical protein [Apilactobacillus apisilvae]UQS85780.1 hypothetical protein MOO46_07555 [Apilactobacillus apisilvae]